MGPKSAQQISCNGPFALFQQAMQYVYFAKYLPEAGCLFAKYEQKLPDITNSGSSIHQWLFFEKIAFDEFHSDLRGGLKNGQKVFL